MFSGGVKREHYEEITYRSTAQKMKPSIKDFFSKCGQIHRKLRIWSHLLKKLILNGKLYFLCSDKWKSRESSRAKIFQTPFFGDEQPVERTWIKYFSILKSC